MNQVNEDKQLKGERSEIERQQQGFTPGPWTLTDDETYIRPDCLKGTVPLADPASDQRCWPAICSVTPWSQDRWDCLGPEESRANARLIAAAPALYEALKALLATETNLGGVSGIQLLDAVDGARAALALVDGEQTK